MSDIVEQAAVLCSAMASMYAAAVDSTEWHWWSDVRHSLGHSYESTARNLAWTAACAVRADLPPGEPHVRWALACSMLRNGEVLP